MSFHNLNMASWSMNLSTCKVFNLIQNDLFEWESSATCEHKNCRLGKYLWINKNKTLITRQFNHIKREPFLKIMEVYLSTKCLFIVKVMIPYSLRDRSWTHYHGDLPFHAPLQQIFKLIKLRLCWGCQTCVDSALWGVLWLQFVVLLLWIALLRDATTYVKFCHLTIYFAFLKYTPTR